MTRTVRPLVLALAACLTLLAAAPVSAQGLKIGVFDKQRIVDEAKLGLAAKGRFEKLQSAREQEVAEKQRGFEQLQQDYTQKASILTEDKKLDLQRELARARDEWQSAARNADRDLQRAYETALVEIVSKVDPVIAEFGKTNGYDFLLDAAQIAFAREAHDVTPQLISKINALYPQ
jgi:outer membrane protein